MEQFVYSDIFATKGIEYIIIIGFLLLMIPFWMWLNKPLNLRVKVGEAMEILSLQALRIPQGLFYNRNHTWSHLEKTGLASVGMDDLLLHLTGGVELEYLKERQERVKRGDPIARIIQEGKDLVITSPISGEIERVHSSLQEDPGAISKDPYNSWLYRIRPEKWREETSESFMAEEAMEWASLELSRFKDFLAEALVRNTPEHATVLQEGGELTSYPLREMDQTVWQGFQDMFLNL